MAQARTAAASRYSSDDPLENVSMWLQMNSRPILYAVAGAAVVAVAIWGYRYTARNKSTKAAVALYAARAPMQEGKLPEAASALERVATRFSGTSAGEQSAMLLAQVQYDQGKYQEGINALEKARGSASGENIASFDALMATGYEGLKNPVKAAELYARAAEQARFSADKNLYLSSQARQLMMAGKLEESRKIWLALRTDDGSQFAQEARVRLGEIMATPAPK